MIIGYTAGVFDLFHVGHVNILRKAKSECDYLIVGVTTDELARETKGRCIIPFEERCEILNSIKFVDKVVAQNDFDKVIAWQEYGYHKLFVGDDWKGTKDWETYESKLNQLGAQVIYFPYTQGTSSTLINATLEKLRRIDKI